MGSLLQVPGLDTRLARALLERRRVEYPTLHAALTKVRALRRSSAHTLALELVQLGLVDAADLEATLAELLGGGGGERWVIGETVAGLELLGSLGAGGMGEVLLARDLETGSEVAVKTLRIDEDEELLVRFQREAEAQARVDAHPNVVRIHRSGMAGGRAFLVMDAVGGGDLAHRLESGPLDPATAAALVRDLAQGLAYAHQLGVLHRDLKPANVLFDERGTPRLADFGLARLLDADALTQTGEILGTPSYMAPEQANSDPQDERTDVYGLGGILYAALTATPPFAGASVYALLEQVISAPAPDPRSRVPGIPADLALLCMRCLEKSPADRFASALEVSAALSGFLEGARAPSRRRAYRTVGLLLLGLTAVGAVAAFALSTQQTPPPSPRLVVVTPTPAPSGAPTSPDEIREQILRAGGGLEGALLAEAYLARGLRPKRWLEDRAAEPFLRLKIPGVVCGVQIGEGRVFAWRAGQQSKTGALAFLVEESTSKVVRTWSETFLAKSPGRPMFAFMKGNTVRIVESQTWKTLHEVKCAAVTGATFGKSDLWITGREGLTRVPLQPFGSPSVVWSPSRTEEDAASVRALPNGNLVVASGRATNSEVGLRCLSPTGAVLWKTPPKLFLGKPRALTTSPNGRWALFGTSSGEIALFSTATKPGDRQRPPERLFKRPEHSSSQLAGSPAEIKAGLVPRAHRTSTVSLLWISDEVFLSTDDAPPAYNLWRIDGECLANDLGKSLQPHSFSFSRDGALVFVASERKGLLIGVLRSSLFPKTD